MNDEKIGVSEVNTDMREDKKEDKEKATKSFFSQIPLFAKMFYLSGVVAALLFAAYIISEPFADFFNRYISSVYRAIFAKLTGFIPFSLAEAVIIALPLILVVMIGIANRRFSDSWRQVGVFCVSLLSVLSLFFAAFAVGFAPGYHGSTLDKKLGIERTEVSAEELYHTASILAENIEKEVDAICFRQQNFSIMPYTYREMNDKLIAAYDKACEKYPFIQRLDSNLKPVMFSEAMSYMHITGVYTFFTGEANINIDFPDYTVPYTAAHELAHQRGVAREDEANFVAYLVCIESDDAYIRYCAYLNLYEYVANALYKASPELYADLQTSLDMRVRYEMNAFSEFFEKYRGSVASDISGVVNDTYLTIQGTPGTASYGMVVDLAVAYYRAK